MKPIVKTEDALREITELAETVARRGRASGEETLAQQNLVRRLERRPELTETFIAEAMRALEDEVDLAEPVSDEPHQIDPAEVDREVAKKALARLKLPQLRRIAEATSLDPRGKEEDVIERIVRAYDVDASEIARLVLTNEEAREERGVTDRLFPIFNEGIDLESAESQLRMFVQRYLRTGIARWFVFQDVERHDDFLFLNGVFRTYRVEPKGEAEDFSLDATESALGVRVRVNAVGRFLEARSRGTTEARSGVTAVSKTLGLRLWEGLPIETRPREGNLLRWDHRSVFVVSFLQDQLAREPLSIFNLTSAQFETGDSAAVDENRPSVRSVKFEGTHLLSSKPACELLVEGRALVGISALLRFAPNPEEAFLVPVRVTLDRDHVTVLTGFASNRSQVARDVQGLIVNRLKAALGKPLENESGLERLAEKIVSRARDADDVTKADILAPGQSDDVTAKG